jgi:hypothetical protein
LAFSSIQVITFPLASPSHIIGKQLDIKSIIIIFSVIILFFVIILKSLLLEKAQRLVAQPLGRFRYIVTILAGILIMQSNVLSLSLGQSLPSRGFSEGRLQPLVGQVFDLYNSIC